MQNEPEITSVQFQTDIIPLKPVFIDLEKNKVTNWGFNASRQLDPEAICYFVACGFFIGSDTYYKNIKVAEPATKASISGSSINKEKYWHWHYTPRDILLSQAVDEFSHIFERVCLEDLGNRKVILPLSGGLDSRSQAVALRNYSNKHAFSYEFEHGIDEVKYAREIASKLQIPFNSYTIRKGYLWDVINDLADINLCFSEFTHPRQMAVLDQISKLGEVFHLGHMGDLLFDNMSLPANYSFEQQIDILYARVLKKGGFELGEALWDSWGLPGNFSDALKSRLQELLAEIKIDEPNARLRAFKSLYWVPRWTSTNMLLFAQTKPVIAPYYHPDMCRFICTVPEHLLNGRKIQIEYMKRQNPEVASVAWQKYYPLNLNNYHKYYSKAYLPNRLTNRLKRDFKKLLNGGKNFTLRNWELQFLGEKNREALEKHLFQNKNFEQFVDKKLVKDFYTAFKDKMVFYSHPLSMLLTLSVFSTKQYEEKT